MAAVGSQARLVCQFPLAGYAILQVEPFTVEQSAATKEFPAGEELGLQIGTVAGISAKGIFSGVVG